MEPKTKQYLLITVVGVTLFVALLRLSSVLTFAAQLVDLVLPILAGGILALFINVPMTGLEKRLKRLFCKAKKQPSDKVLHLLSFFITLLGVVLVLVLALTLLIPELMAAICKENVCELFFRIVIRSSWLVKKSGTAGFSFWAGRDIICRPQFREKLKINGNAWKSKGI